MIAGYRDREVTTEMVNGLSCSLLTDAHRLVFGQSTDVAALVVHMNEGAKPAGRCMSKTSL